MAVHTLGPGIARPLRAPRSDPEPPDASSPTAPGDAADGFADGAREPVVAPPPPVVDALYSVGHWLLGAGRVADAADVFRTLLLVSPTDERGWLALAECHEQNDQPRIALELYSAGSVAAEPSARCLVGRARVLRTLGQDDEADQAAALALELALRDEAAELVALARAETGEA